MTPRSGVITDKTKLLKSALGHFRPKWPARVMSAFPDSDHSADIWGGPFRAIVGSKYACVQCEIPADLPFRKTSLRYPILVGLTHKLMRKYSAYARGEPSIPVVFRCRIDGPRGPQHGRATERPRQTATSCHYSRWHPRIGPWFFVPRGLRPTDGQAPSRRRALGCAFDVGTL